MATGTARVHVLKALPEHWQAVQRDEKRVELRKDDRGFRVGDHLVLVEWRGYEGHRQAGVPGAAGLLQANVLVERVTHIVRGGPWLAPEYVALSIRHVDPEEIEATPALLAAVQAELGTAVEAWGADMRRAVGGIQ